MQQQLKNHRKPAKTGRKSRCPKTKRTAKKPVVTPSYKLTFSERAFAKMQALIDNYTGEVSWHGTVVRESDAAFTIEDILVHPQYADVSNVDTDQTRFNKWLYSFDDTLFYKLRMRGHSHGMGEVFWSGKDRNHHQRLVSQLVKDMFYIFIVMNRKYSARVVLYITDAAGKPKRYEDNEISTCVLLGGNAVTFEKATKYWKAGKIDTSGLDAFLKDACKMVTVGNIAEHCLKEETNESKQVERII